MEALVEKGLTKSIGVSNFNTQLIWDLLTYARIKPVVNQIELHPQNPQPELVRFLLAKNILPVAYCPVSRPTGDRRGLLDNEFLKSLAEKYGKTVVQVMLNWGLCRGHCLIPKANSPTH